MLEVIKRSGAQEPFNSDKIRATLSLCSDEIKQPLNDSDINAIVADIEALLEGKSTVQSGQIYVLIVGFLYVRGLHDVLRHYADYPGNSWQW